MVTDSAGLTAPQIVQLVATLGTGITLVLAIGKYAGRLETTQENMAKNLVDAFRSRDDRLNRHEQRLDQADRRRERHASRIQHIETTLEITSSAAALEETAERPRFVPRKEEDSL